MSTRKRLKTSQAQLDKLLADAVVDCYGEDEEFSGVLVTVGDNLPFPFEAKVLDQPVQVTGVDERRSDLRRGIIAIVSKGGKKYRVALSELDVPDNFKGRKWLDLYEYWVGGTDDT